MKELNSMERNLWQDPVLWDKRILALILSVCVFCSVRYIKLLTD